MNEKNTFWKWLINNKEWIFSGIGVAIGIFILTSIISIFSDDSQNSVTTINNEFGDNANYTATVGGDNIKGNKNVYQQAPSSSNEKIEKQLVSENKKTEKQLASENE